MSVVEQLATVQDLVVVEVAERPNGLEVSWNDGHTSFFHFIWLRDCCYCEHCGDSYSSKRYLVPSDVSLDVRPMSVKIGKDGTLEITWEPDGHRSHYDGSWLRRHCYDEASRLARRHEPILWNSELDTTSVEVDFEAVRCNDSDRLDLYRKLRDYGCVIVRNGPSEPGSIETVASMVGEMGDSAYSKIFDLTPSGSAANIGNSTRPVPPHTDEAFRFSPPGINILACVHPASDGGDSVLVDGFNITETMRKEMPEGFELLATQAHIFHRLHEGNIDQLAQVRMIALDSQQRVCGVRIHTRASGPMNMPEELVEPFYAAHHKLSELMMSPANQLRFRLGAGDTAFFDNHRVLHARTDFTDRTRHMQICNVSREDFYERLRILARRLGYQEEADQILSPGMAW